MPKSFSLGDFFQAAQIARQLGLDIRDEKDRERVRKLQEAEAARAQGRYDAEVDERAAILPFRQEAMRAGYGGDVRAHGKALIEADTTQKNILAHTLGLVRSGVLREEEGPKYAAAIRGGMTPNQAFEQATGERREATSAKAETTTERERALATYQDKDADPDARRAAAMFLGFEPRAARPSAAGGDSATVKPSFRSTIAGFDAPKRAAFENVISQLPEPTAADTLGAINTAKVVPSVTPEAKLEAAAKNQAKMLLDIAFPTGEGKAAPTPELRTLARALALAKTQTERDRILDPYLDDNGAWEMKKLRKLFQVKAKQ